MRHLVAVVAAIVAVSCTSPKPPSQQAEPDSGHGGAPEVGEADAGELALSDGAVEVTEGRCRNLQGFAGLDSRFPWQNCRIAVCESIARYAPSVLRADTQEDATSERGKKQKQCVQQLEGVKSLEEIHDHCEQKMKVYESEVCSGGSTEDCERVEMNGSLCETLRNRCWKAVKCHN